ncbi:MAG: fluoride efflux transporter CrcB [Pseudomonadota bacterium]|nr:fluoride efflux transporter CrcB [Pseudomonadota bacterium]
MRDTDEGITSYFMINMVIVFISILGVLGVLCRFWLSRFNDPGFPWGTLAANLIGCYALGTIYYFSEIQDVIGPGLKLAIAVGFLGALTTFSTFMIECVQFLLKQEYLRFLGYFLISNFLCLAATWLAIWLPTRILK